jgi:hypothetical protein
MMNTRPADFFEQLLSHEKLYAAQEKAAWECRQDEWKKRKEQTLALSILTADQFEERLHSHSRTG